VAIGALVWRFWLRGEIIVGADGMVFARRFRRRFVPFAEIESVSCDGDGRLVLRTRGGATSTPWMPLWAARAAHEAIQSSLASMMSGTASTAGGFETWRRQLRRHASDKDASAWLARVRALAQPESYRAPGFAADVLWRVVDDPDACETERAAAAVVLGMTATPEERERLREAAARIASPRVRVAIERVAAHPPCRSGVGTDERGEVGPEASDDELLAAMDTIVEAPRSP
jgi:hypothetical protein